MASLTIERTLAGAALVAAGLALALAPAASQASSSTAPALPEATTGGAHALGSSDELEGTVNPEKLTTTYYFQYGPTNSYGSQTPNATLPAEPAEPVQVSQTVTGMQAGWRYRLVASNADGTAEGREHIFSVKVTNKKTSKTGFELSGSTEPTVVGEPFVLSGTLAGPGNGNRQIVLQESPYPYRDPYANLGAPILTSPGGAFSFRVPDFTHSARFRIATVGVTPLYSRIVTELAAVRVVLKVRITRHAKGLVRLYGTVSPAAVGARVLFQLEKPPKQKPPKSGRLEKPGKSERSSEEKPPSFATKFSAAVEHATKSLSRFTLVVKIQEAGNYRALVELPPGPLASGHSQTVALQAGPTTGKHKKK
jgi:hypothetical protein